MQESYTPVLDEDAVCDATALSLLPTVSVVGLPERLTERVDEHCSAHERMREGLLAVSTAVGLDVMAS